MSVKQHYKKIITLASIGAIAFAIGEASAQSSPDDFFANTTATPAAKTGGAMPAFNAKRMSSSMGTPSDQLVGKLSAEIFQEMVDLERENAVLALQLKREALQSEIETLKASQREQIMQEIERREELARARIEWEKEQEVKLLEAKERLERQRIREKQIDAVIARNEEERRQKADEEKRRIEAEQEAKLKAHLEELRLINERNEEERRREDEARAKQAAATTPSKNTTVSDDQFWGGSAGSDVATGSTPTPDITAPAVPKKDGVATTTAGNEVPSNAVDQPKTDSVDATGVVVEVPVDPKASEKYYVLEIRGLGDDLVAKLSNKENTSSFFVRIGSTLGTGHEITSINHEYVEAKLNDKVDQIGFLTGGVAYTPKNN